MKLEDRSMTYKELLETLLEASSELDTIFEELEFFDDYFEPLKNNQVNVLMRTLGRFRKRAETTLANMERDALIKLVG